MNLHYYDKIRKIREFKGYKQESIAEKLKISQRAYSSIENGKTQLTIERLVEIAKILDVSIMEILELESNTIFNNNFNNNATHNQGNLIFKKDDFEEQRKLYERIIEMKDKEIEFLREQLSKFK